MYNHRINYRNLELVVIRKVLVRVALDTCNFVMESVALVRVALGSFVVLEQDTMVIHHSGYYQSVENEVDLVVEKEHSFVGRTCCFDFEEMCLVVLVYH